MKGRNLLSPLLIRLTAQVEEESRKPKELSDLLFYAKEDWQTAQLTKAILG